jgi:hypothetical protein
MSGYDVQIASMMRSVVYAEVEKLLLERADKVIAEFAKEVRQVTLQRIESVVTRVVDDLDFDVTDTHILFKLRKKES